nr:MAG TPA: hypothetical protein [Caudoviricetes sp.]
MLPPKLTVRKNERDFGGDLKRHAHKSPGQRRYNFLQSSDGRRKAMGYRDAIELLAQRMDMCERLEASSMGSAMRARGTPGPRAAMRRRFWCG